MTKDELKKALARNLRIILALKNLKPAELADQAGISRSTVSRILNAKGETSLYGLYCIASHLKTPFHILLAKEVTAIYGGVDV